jgi:hypothetical protein
MRRRPSNEGVIAGVLGCVLALFGIFSIGLVFIPLAALCSLVGLLSAIAGRSLTGFLMSAIGTTLTVVGIAVSPSVLALVLAMVAPR